MNPAIGEDETFIFDGSASTTYQHTGGAQDTFLFQLFGAAVVPSFAGQEFILDLPGSARSTIAAVPEPSTIALISLGTFVLLGYNWRRRKKAADKDELFRNKIVMVRRPVLRALLVAISFASFLTPVPRAAAGIVTYAFEHKNKTDDAAFDFHAEVNVLSPTRFEKDVAAQDFTLSDSKPLGWKASLSISDDMKTATIDWAGNQFVDKNQSQKFRFGIKNINEVRTKRSFWTDVFGDELEQKPPLPGFVVIDK